MRHKTRTHQSTSFVARRRRRAIIAILSIIGIFVIIVIVLALIFNLSFLSINSVRIEGADPDISASLQSAATTAIQGKYFGLFSKANAFIYPRGAVTRAVHEASARVEVADVGLDDLHQITVQVTEKAPHAVVCPYFPDFETSVSATSVSVPDSSPSSDACYFADENGQLYALAPALYSSANVTSQYPKYYTPDLDDKPGEDLSGKYATSTKEFLGLQSLYTDAKSAGFDIKSILIKEGGEYEMYIPNPDKSIAIVYFNDNRTMKDQLANLVSFWGYMVTDAKSTNTKTTKPSFDYIDVRYGTNIFYRII